MIQGKRNDVVENESGPSMVATIWALVANMKLVREHGSAMLDKARSIL